MWLSSNWQEELEFWGQLVLGVEPVGEIDSSDSAISMNLDPQGLYVIGTVSSSCEIRQVKLNLIPSFIESHWHGANEWLHTGGRLIVGGSETTANVLVVKHLHLESEIFLQLVTGKHTG